MRTVISLLLAAVLACGTTDSQSSIRYASPSGSDSNTGASWDTAKKTIFAALEALPGGSTNPPTAGGGTVYVADSTWANPIQYDGIWIMGPRDPNYANPPVGWLRQPIYNSLSIIGQGCSSYLANATAATCWIQGGDKGVGTGIWLSGTNRVMQFENLHFQYPQHAISMGINSNGNRSDSTGQVQGVHFVRVTGEVDQVSYDGPTVDIGAEVYNVYFEQSGFQGNSAGMTRIHAFSRAGNVLTVTTDANTLHSGQKCGILQASDTHFNGSFQGGITVLSPTQLTVQQSGPDMTLPTASGYVVCDNALPVVIDPAGGINSGLIWFRDMVYNGGGVRVWGGPNTVIYAHGALEESGVAPPMWVGSIGQYGLIDTSDFYFADNIGNPIFNVINDSGSDPQRVLYRGCVVGTGGACTDGPVTIISQRNQ